MRYDYSLDVGQSMESEEELKARQEKEKQQAQENPPASGEELSAKRMEAEIKQEADNEAENADASEEIPEERVEEAADNNSEEQLAGNDSGESSKEAEKEDISVKEISFEKAKLIEEHQKAQKTIEDWEKKEQSEETGEDEDSEEKPKDELEEDVSEMIEDSFKESQSYMSNSANNHSGPKEYEEPKKSYAIPIALAVIFLCAIIFGFVYFMYPEKTTAAATVDIPGEEINLEPAAAPESPETVVAENATKPKENITAAVKENVTKVITANATQTVPKENATKSAAANATKKPVEELKKEAKQSDERVLNDILLSGLN